MSEEKENITTINDKYVKSRVEHWKVLNNRLHQYFAEKNGWTSEQSRDLLAIGLSGEVGELLNLIKKQIRDGKLDHEEIEGELADVLLYLDLLAKYYDVNLDLACQKKAEHNMYNRWPEAYQE